MPQTELSAAPRPREEVLVVSVNSVGARDRELREERASSGTAVDARDTDSEGARELAYESDVADDRAVDVRSIVGGPSRERTTSGIAAGRPSRWLPDVRRLSEVWRELEVWWLTELCWLEVRWLPEVWRLVDV